MSEIGDDFKELRKERQERHQANAKKNTRALVDAGILFTFTNWEKTCAVIRENGKPKVDFYPHTGRWRSENKTYSGGVEAFISWYLKQQR